MNLPPPTQSGNNTLGCKINGKVWQPEIGVNFHPNYSQERLGVNYEPKQKVFSLSARREFKDYFNAEIDITIQDSILEGKRYTFSKVDDNNNYAIIRRDCMFTTKSWTDGFLKFTKIDTVKQIISGRFAFDALKDTSYYRGRCKELSTISVADGRFDLKYGDP